MFGQVLKELQKTDPTLIGSCLHNPSFTIIKSLYFNYISYYRPDIKEIYHTYSKVHLQPVINTLSFNPFPALPRVNNSVSSQRRSSLGIINFRTRNNYQKRNTAQHLSMNVDPSETMSLKAFTDFLAKTEGKEYDPMETAAIIKKYAVFDDSESVVDHITLKGFTHYMMSKEAIPPPHPRTQITERMDYPLSDYHIATSHNTYLTGHQLHGESSVAMYIQVSSSCKHLYSLRYCLYSVCILL